MGDKCVQLIPFEPEHFRELLKSPRFELTRRYITSDYLDHLREQMSYTGVLNDKILFCAGVIEFWRNRGEAWAIIADGHREHFMKINSTVRKFLDNCPCDRIEATVEVGNKNGHRWVRTLGFKLEAPLMRKYFQGGGDASLYARTREKGVNAHG